MKTLLLTSFLIIGSAGSMSAKAADIPIPDPNSGNVPKLMAPTQILDGNGRNCPKPVAEIPIPNPNSKKCPQLVG